MTSNKRLIISFPRSTFAVCGEKLKKSIIIIKKTQKVVNSLFSVYESVQKSRKSNKGLTEKEGDILRSMLIFSASGLDSVVKQLVRDTMLDVTKKNLEVQKQLEKYIERKLKTKNTEGVDILDMKFVSQVLATRSPYERIIEIEIDELTGGSLQSKDELLKIASTFAIEPNQITKNVERLKEIFDARNQMIHEMDINLKSASNKRRNRNGETMCSYSNELIQVGCNFILAVNAKL